MRIQTRVRVRRLRERQGSVRALRLGYIGPRVIDLAPAFEATRDEWVYAYAKVAKRQNVVSRTALAITIIKQDLRHPRHRDRAKPIIAKADLKRTTVALNRVNVMRSVDPDPYPPSPPPKGYFESIYAL